MVLVIVSSLVTAFLLLLQGLHILRNSNMRPFFEQSSNLRGSRSSLRFGPRVAATLLYLLPSFGIVCILTIAFLRSDTHRLIDWMRGHGGGLIGGLFLLTYGLFALLRPDMILRWVRSAYPDPGFSDRNPSLRPFIRGLGALVSVFGLFILKSL